jgi:hypothetical protein
MAPAALIDGTLVNPVLVHLVSREDIFTAERLQPTESQKWTLIVGGIFLALFIMYPFGRYILYPFEVSSVPSAFSSLSHSLRILTSQMLNTALHEFCHAFVAVLTCSKVHAIELNPNASGATHFAKSGGKLTEILIDSAGYVGSALIGACLVFCGFNIVASKGATIGLGVIFVITLFWARKDWITWVTCLAASGLIVGCWLIDHAKPLRFFILLLGIMSCSWSLKDTYDIIRGRTNGTDAHNLAETVGGSPKVWAFLWTFISLSGMAGAICLALLVWKDTDEKMWQDSQKFLPTR